MNNLHDINHEDKMIVDYVHYVLSLSNTKDRLSGDSVNESTTLFLYTKQFGILTPAIVHGLIERGSIVVISNKKEAA